MADNSKIEKRSILKMVFRPEDGVKPKHKGETDRTKYFVVVGVDDDRVLVGSVLINSEINSRLFNRIAEHQYRITSEAYKFMTKEESYIDCYKLIEIPLERVLNDAEYIGSLIEEDYAHIRNQIRKSPAITPITLKRFHLK